jgi:hypothetical protein
MATSVGGEYLSTSVNRIYKATGATPLEYAIGLTKSLPTINEMIDRSQDAP